MSFRQHGKAKPQVIRVADRLIMSFDEVRVQSEMRLGAPDDLVLGYTRTMMGFLLYCPQPLRIAMIGLGGGSIPKYCYATLPDADITVVEINPDVIALRSRFFVPDDDVRFRVRCEDGAEFVARMRNQFDVLIVDGFIESGQPPVLSTQRFYNDCRDCLTEFGLMIVNLPDLPQTYQPLFARIKHSFDHQALLVAAEDSGNQIVFAGKGGSLNCSSEQLQERAASLTAHSSLKLARTVQMVGYAQARNCGEIDQVQ
jgi:spermidine synthase